LFGSRANPVLAARLRLSLNAPYLLLVLAFAVFDVVQTIRYGGSVKVPGGLGPGAWLGVAGSLLCAQPVISDAATAEGRLARWLVGARIIGYASIVVAALSFMFVLFCRVRYALPSSADTSGFGKQNIAVMVTAVVYGVVGIGRRHCRVELDRSGRQPVPAGDRGAGGIDPGSWGHRLDPSRRS
jgi:hypothetical protein